MHESNLSVCIHQLFIDTILVASPPGVPAGFVKGLNNVFQGITRGPLYARLAKGVATTSTSIEPSAILARNFINNIQLPPLINDEYIAGLKTFLPSSVVGKRVDFVSEARNGGLYLQKRSQH